MASLKYITRGMVSPQGLPKVYFCSGEKDFTRYFEVLSSEILSMQNCAIWYVENQSVEMDEDFLADLAQMQLFVMPVTSELLFTDNRVLSAEFPFALEHHIPVLPIMMEGSLTKEFCRRCGDLQYLDRYTQDDTAISFDEKLRQFLQAVLIGDETAQKVRDAFDAYIFLSYRKKDRRHAQELMRLIHKNDFCRDIAIWYDEFLTPGENFNDNIGKALNKSQLFALAVTPNLVNEDNYVQSVEYPMAVDAGKVIIPAQVVPTDRALLGEKFRGIPQVFDAHDEWALSGAMMYALNSIAIRENDNSAEHNFFIGLAYLGGIDVEVDYDRALALITSAAESGLIEAAGKLVEMYRTGMGVARNLTSAIAWQEKKVELLRAQYNAAPDEQLHNTLFWQIIYCGDYYSELGRTSEALSKYYDGMLFVSSYSYPDKDRVLRRDLAVSYQRISNVKSSTGDLQEALLYCNKTTVITEQLWQELRLPEHYRDVAICYNKTGHILSLLGKADESAEYYAKAIGIREKISMVSDSVEAKTDLAESCIRTGESLRKQGDLNRASVYFGKSIALTERLAAQTESVKCYTMLATAYSNMGDLRVAEGDLQMGYEYYRKSLDIFEGLAEKYDTIEILKNLAVARQRIGDILKAQGKIQEAMVYYTKASETEERLALGTKDVKVSRNLAVSYIKIADGLKASGDIEKASDYYAKALRILDKLQTETAYVEYKNDYILCCNRIGNLYYDQRLLPRAAVYYGKALAVAEKFAEESGTPMSLDRLAETYYNLAYAIPEKRQEYLYKTCEIYSRLSAQCPDVKRYRDCLVAVRRELQSI